jgi:uncharacterized protein YyaL (SSP411 family)
LLEVRSTRPRPHLDDKALTAWNGLMIAAFARAGRAFERADYVDAARRAATFVRSRLWNPADRSLWRRIRNEAAGVEGYAEDYAYLVFGLLELFQADGDPAWLEWALVLQSRQDELFWDAAGGGWFSTTGKDASVLLRLKEEYDGAEPAASSVAALNLLTLSHLTADAAMAEKIDRTFAAFAGLMTTHGRTVPMMLAALSSRNIGLPQIVIAGDRMPSAAAEASADKSDAGELQSVVRRHYLPTAIVVSIDEAHRPAMTSLLPWTEALRARDGRATAYVCQDFACASPATSAQELEERLKEVR